MPRSVALILHRAKELEQWKKTLYIVFFAQLMSTVGFSTIFPFLPLYVAELGSRSGLSIELLSGLVFSAQAFTMMLAAPFWGSMADRHGRKMMIQRATFGGAITVLAMGFATSAEMLVGIRTIQGIVTGTVTAANALIAATVPREKIGYAMGLMQVGLWGGVAVGPLMGGALADAFGYRLSFIITGVLLFLAGILVWWGVHENFTPKPADPNKKKQSMLASWRAVIVTKGVPAIFFFRFMNGLGRMLVYPILPLFIATLLPATAPHNFYTGLITGVYGAASTVTAVLLGKLGDRIGHRQILMACTLVAALTYIPQMWVTAAWQLLILQALAGGASGGIITAVSALLAQFTKPGDEGNVYGMDASVNSGSRAAAPLIGAALASFLDYRLTLGLNGVLFVLMFLSVLWLLPKRQEEAAVTA